ncbi:MAG: 2-oxoacid:acceptor oxidoreductase family protein [Acidobacteria bacterium]|nr:2-oxoacid:acceptor oxidoreductase family protein [Acidobacteriota bacterium]
MTAFYPHFERHAHGEGLKGQATHYCPGCGHGLVHKYLADCIDELNIKDRTVAVSPVGCAVFLYYYLDVGNTQAAHGRAPAVALGHKLANPESIVISYQGDGDLASIGLAEIIHAAQLGIPITVVFINNAIYGMTGGQLAPTTLMEQTTTTTPMGRDMMAGQPIRMAELIAQLDGPVYVERVALYDNKQRMRAKKAIMKGLKLQVENIGFSFIEVLAECPTHLKKSPQDAETWVKEQMVPVYPLGVKKDMVREPWFPRRVPEFDPVKLLQALHADQDDVPRFNGFPSHIHPDDVAIKLAGAGGDGAQTAAMLLAQCGVNEGFDATYIPSYGPESRGGTSFADVHIAREQVLTPSATQPHILVAFNAPSLAKFGPTVQPGGCIVYDSTVIHDLPDLPEGVTVYAAPLTDIGVSVGFPLIKNIAALGALAEVTHIFPTDALIHTIRHAMKHKCSMIPFNESAFDAGKRQVQCIQGEKPC